MSVIIHEDKPRYALGLKLIFGVVFAVFIYGGAQVYLNEGQETAFFMLIPIVVVGLALYVAMPRRYQVLDDRIRVVLGSPLVLNYRFFNLKEVVQRGGIWFSVNFVTSFSSKRVVYVIRSKGMPIAISPSDPQVFINASERAMASWKRIGGAG